MPRKSEPDETASAVSGGSRLRYHGSSWRRDRWTVLGTGPGKQVSLRAMPNHLLFTYARFTSLLGPGYSYLCHYRRPPALRDYCFDEMSKLPRLLRWLPLPFFLSGCSVEHGQIDFVSPPLFQLNFGEYSSLIFFSDSTVLQTGGTYYFLSIPFWLLLLFSVSSIAFVAWITYRRAKRERIS